MPRAARAAERQEQIEGSAFSVRMKGTLPKGYHLRMRIAATFVAVLVACVAAILPFATAQEQSHPTSQSKPPQTQRPPSPTKLSLPITYRNTDYDFCFSLP